MYRTFFSTLFTKRCEKTVLYLPNSCPVPGVLRNRPGCYEPLIFDACIIEILARRLCCDNPNIFANFDAENTDTSASWTFLSWWKEGLASDRVCLNVELCFTEALKRSDRWRCACRSTQEQRQLGQARFAVCQFSVLLQKALLKARFENICTHPIAFQRGVSLWTLASWDGTPTVAKFFRTCQENQKSFNSKPPQSLVPFKDFNQMAWEPKRSGFEVLPSKKTSM